MTEPTKTKQGGPKARSQTTKTVALRIRSAAHVDRADLAEGVVTKTQDLIVPADIAKQLLNSYPYLTKAGA